MSGVDRRQLIPHVAIGLAVCLGAYMLLVDGAYRNLVNTKAQTASLAVEVQVAESLGEKIPAMTAALERVSRRAESIAAKGRPARDERSLYAAITAMAGEHRVRLDELNPVRKAANAAAAATAPLPGATTTRPVVAETSVGYSMVAIARYDDLAAFLGAMRMDLGFSCIRSVRITPVQDERVKLVRATIETEHFSFETTLRGPTTADAGAR